MAYKVERKYDSHNGKLAIRSYLQEREDEAIAVKLGNMDVHHDIFHYKDSTIRYLEKYGDNKRLTVQVFSRNQQDAEAVLTELETIAKKGE